MFVAAPFRGRTHGVAQALLGRLLEDAATRGVRDIFLSTTDRFPAAHRFYEKNSFEMIDAEARRRSFHAWRSIRGFMG